MSFGWFLLIGWIHIRCRHCSTRLVLRSLGNRFWNVLAGGAVAVAAILVFVDYPFRAIGQKGTMILFVAIIAATILFSTYYAWKDSRFDLLERS